MRGSAFPGDGEAAQLELAKVIRQALSPRQTTIHRRRLDEGI
jgi:hypothetical protein